MILSNESVKFISTEKHKLIVTLKKSQLKYLSLFCRVLKGKHNQNKERTDQTRKKSGSFSFCISVKSYLCICR